MCGRYGLFLEESQEIASMLRNMPGEIKTGEIFPTNPVPVFVERRQAVEPQAMIWGYPRFQGKSGVIINARSETALERPMFRKSVMERRCVFPTTGFYEWGSDAQGKKQKYRFNRPGTGKALYLAGLWNDFAGDRRCVILTAAANASMRDIHHRMPVILDQSKLDDWVRDPDFALELLRQTPPSLQRVPAEPPERQLTIF